MEQENTPTTRPVSSLALHLSPQANRLPVVQPSPPLTANPSLDNCQDGRLNKTTRRDRADRGVRSTLGGWGAVAVGLDGGGSAPKRALGLFVESSFVGHDPAVVRCDGRGGEARVVGGGVWEEEPGQEGRHSMPPLPLCHSITTRNSKGDRARQGTKTQPSTLPPPIPPRAGGSRPSDDAMTP